MKYQSESEILDEPMTFAVAIKAFRECEKWTHRRR